MYLPNYRSCLDGAVCTPESRGEVDGPVVRWLNRVASAPAFALFDWDSGMIPEGSLPALDVYEDPRGWVVKLEVPGARKEDLTLNLQDGVLTITGERKQDPHKDAKVCRCERVSGRFARSVRIPWKVDDQNIKAACTAGVLTVTVPKAEEAKPHRIQIEVK